MVMLLFGERASRGTESASRCDQAENCATMQHRSAPFSGWLIDGAAWEHITATSLRQSHHAGHDLAISRRLLVVALRDQFVLRAITNLNCLRWRQLPVRSRNRTFAELVGLCSLS